MRRELAFDKAASGELALAASSVSVGEEAVHGG
jgi:hypothetical protein